MSCVIDLSIRKGTKLAALFEEAAKGSAIPAPLGSPEDYYLPKDEIDVRWFSRLLFGQTVKLFDATDKNQAERYVIVITRPTNSKVPDLSIMDVRGIEEATCPWDYPDDASPAVIEAKVILDGKLYSHCIRGVGQKIPSP